MNNKKKKPRTATTTEQPAPQTKPLTQRQLADIYTLQQMQEEGEAYQAAYDMAGMNSMPVAPLTPEQLAIRDKLNSYYDAKQKDPSLRPKFEDGGQLGSVLSGLLADSGPITSGVGSFINFVTGSLDQQKQEAAERKMRSQSLNAMYYSTPAATNTLGLTATYPMGGQIAAPNAELEKQEGFRVPNQNGQPIVGNVNGPSHDQGGVPVALPNGTQIYSDRLKHVSETGKKETFAETEARYKRQLSRYQKETSDPISKRTNQMMSERIQAKLQALFDEQEAMKAAQEIQPTKEEFKQGGVVGQPNLKNNLNVVHNTQYPNGGLYNNPYNYINFANKLNEYGPYTKNDAQAMWDNVPLIENDNTDNTQSNFPVQNPGYQAPQAAQLPSGIQPGTYGQLSNQQQKLSPGMTKVVGANLNLEPGYMGLNPQFQNTQPGFSLDPQYPATQIKGASPNDYNLNEKRNRELLNARGSVLSSGIQVPDPNSFSMNMFNEKENLLFSDKTQNFVNNMQSGIYGTPAQKDDKTVGLNDESPETDGKGLTRKIIGNIVQNTLSSAAELAPQIYNLFQKRPEEKNIDRFMNTDAIKAERMNVTQQVRDLERTYAAMINDQSLSPAERLMASRQLQSEKNRLYQGVDNQYIADTNRAKEMNTAIKQQNIATSMTLQDQYDADTAAYMNMKAQAAGDISQYTQKRRLENNTNSQNEQVKNALISAFPNYNFNKDGSITNKTTGEPMTKEEMEVFNEYINSLTAINQMSNQSNPYWNSGGYSTQTAYDIGYGYQAPGITRKYR